MLIATIAVTTLLLALSFVQLRRWNEARNGASIRQDDISFVPTLIAYPMFAILAVGSVVLVCIAARQSGNSPYGWVYHPTAILCSALCLAACIETRHTFIKFEGDEMVIHSLARHRTIRVSDAANVLGWNVSLRTRLDLLGMRRL